MFVISFNALSSYSLIWNKTLNQVFFAEDHTKLQSYEKSLQVIVITLNVFPY